MPLLCREDILRKINFEINRHWTLFLEKLKLKNMMYKPLDQSELEIRIENIPTYALFLPIIRNPCGYVNFLKE